MKFALADAPVLPPEKPYSEYNIVQGDFSSDALAAAKKANKVVLSLLVKEDGTADDVRLVQSSGDSDLDAKEIVRARSGHFHPTVRDGKPVASRITVDAN